MGLFDEIANKLKGGTEGGEGGQTLVTSILEMLSSQQGGLSGLASAFQQKGLGDIVSSWIGTGQNLPVSAAQLHDVLGGEQIQSLAKKAGIAPETAGSQLAELLPGIVDKLTPNGEIQQGGDLMSMGMGLLKNFISKGES